MSLPPICCGCGGAIFDVFTVTRCNTCLQPAHDPTCLDLHVHDVAADQEPDDVVAQIADVYNAQRMPG